MLTGSGGPFRGHSAEQLERVSVEQALKHPTWAMGAKITIDSATLMNKALELIEARWLFGLDADRLGVVIHPQSMVHSFVEFRDGSVLAQASPPDMRLPIQYALCYPDRPAGPAKRLDWAALRQWTFEPPDRAVFGAIDLGFEVIRSGGTSGAVLNAANEEAVALFLARKIALPEITRMARDILHRHTHVGRPTLSDLLSADRWARQEAARWTRP
jgi:1-deoxy-D-xylulose-5-phosphate reductoisomerase